MRRQEKKAKIQTWDIAEKLNIRQQDTLLKLASRKGHCYLLRIELFCYGIPLFFEYISFAYNTCKQSAQRNYFLFISLENASSCSSSKLKK